MRRFPKGYVECVERLAKLIPEWCGSREQLPDLQFYDHGRIMVGAALEPLTYGLCAKSPDALALLEYLREREPQATMFMVQVVLKQLGFLKGAEVLTIGQIRAKMQGKAPLMMWKRGEMVWN